MKRNQIIATLLLFIALRSNLSLAAGKVISIQLITLAALVICAIAAFLYNRNVVTDGLISAALALGFIQPMSAWALGWYNKLPGIWAAIVPVGALFVCGAIIAIWAVAIIYSNRIVLTKGAAALLGGSTILLAAVTGILCNLLAAGLFIQPIPILSGVWLVGVITILLAIAAHRSDSKIATAFLLEALVLIWFRYIDTRFITKLLEVSLGFDYRVKGILPLILLVLGVLILFPPKKCCKKPSLKKKGKKAPAPKGTKEEDPSNTDGGEATSA